VKVRARLLVPIRLPVSKLSTGWSDAKNWPRCLSLRGRELPAHELVVFSVPLEMNSNPDVSNAWAGAKLKSLDFSADFAVLLAATTL